MLGFIAELVGGLVFDALAALFVKSLSAKWRAKNAR